MFLSYKECNSSKYKYRPPLGLCTDPIVAKKKFVLHQTNDYLTVQEE